MNLCGKEVPWWLSYMHLEVDETRIEAPGGVPMYNLSATDPRLPTYLADFAVTRGSRIG